MKIILSLLLASFAQAGVVHTCNGKIHVDVNQYEAVGLEVLQTNSGYISNVIRTRSTIQMETTLEVLPLNQAMRVSGVRELATAAKIANFNQVTQARIYTAGRGFEDDLAGVRSVEFMDQRGSVLGSAMYFGWGGPVKCE